MSDIRELLEDEKRVEAILFLENTSLSLERISSLTGLNKEDALEALKGLKEHYKERNSALFLSEEEGLYSFQPVHELYPMLRKTYGKKVDKRLTKAVLETLSIIAYKQPVTRFEIDKLRGVTTSDSIVRFLRERDYIKVTGRDSNHANLYCTTRKFLYEFNLKSISELPKLKGEDRLKFTDTEEGELF